MNSSLLARTPVSMKVGLPLVAAALVATACTSGSSGYGAAGAAPAGSRASSNPVSASARTVIRTGSGDDGTFLTDGSGRALYLWAADGRNMSTCTSVCASEWPPLTATGTPTVSGDGLAADVGTITRADGSKQVTYHGHALYYYAGDSSAGQTNGQGSGSFGADWWLVAPNGTKITTGDADG